MLGIWQTKFIKRALGVIIRVHMDDAHDVSDANAHAKKISP